MIELLSQVTLTNRILLLRLKMTYYRQRKKFLYLELTLTDVLVCLTTTYRDKSRRTFDCRLSQRIYDVAHVYIQ